MPLSLSVARFNRRVTNRLTGMFADTAPGFAIVHHVGRRSGRSFSTPVNAFRDGRDYLIALTYGADADWVKNVLAAGGCEVVTRGQRIRLIQPRSGLSSRASSPIWSDAGRRSPCASCSA